VELEKKKIIAKERSEEKERRKEECGFKLQ
jgi:hypothetical protein